jgi:phage baseplate assembly protein V
MMQHAYRAQSLDRRLYGVFTGIVEDNEDPEHEGRVKVRIPWLDDATVSDWCRVMQPYAGPNYGAVWIPEKKCEVLVALWHGDMNEPVVLGGVYNGKDKPPVYKDQTKQDVKMLRTKAGHTIRLDDSSQTMAIEIQTLGGHDIFLDDQNQKITISTPLGQQLVLDDNAQQLELSSVGGVGKVTIDATGKITIQGKDISVTGTSISLSAGNISIG